MKSVHSALLVALALAGPAQAQASDGVVVRETEMSFEDITFGVENAILGEGLVIDHVNKVGDMLDRTADAVNASQDIYQSAVTYSFCSATVSRRAMEADPLLLAYCPYAVFVMVRAATPEVTEVGYIDYPDGPMDEVEALLARIVEAALEGF